MNQSAAPPLFCGVIKGTELILGNIIICNQAYGEILALSPDYIFTSTGNRRFYPLHNYPVFAYPEPEVESEL